MEKTDGQTSAIGPTFLRRLLPVISFVGLMALVAWASASQRTPPTMDWQQSESPSVSLGVRDKNGQVGSYTGVFMVTGPNGKTLTARTRVTGSDWGFVTFPDDFNSASQSPGEIGYVLDGKYSWVCTVNGSPAIKGRFEYSPPSKGTARTVAILTN